MTRTAVAGATASGTRPAPDPDRVFGLDDLVLELDRLRRRAPGGRRVGLDRLARLTGIPRSTLHTYLSGLTLPPPGALEAVVCSLGVGRAEVRRWAAAWERVADARHGSRSRRPVSPTAPLLSFHQEVRRRLTRPGDASYDQLETVALFERVRLGEDRAVESITMLHSCRAARDGVDRFALRLVPSPALDLDALTLTGLVDCAAGDHRTLADLGVRVLEVLLDHPLQAGETTVFQFTIDYRPARRLPAEPTTQALHGFRSRGPSYTLEVRFPPGSAPQQVRQVHVGHVDGPEECTRPLRVTAAVSAHVSVERPSAGLHGIRWEWPDR